MKQKVLIMTKNGICFVLGSEVSYQVFRQYRVDPNTGWIRIEETAVLEPSGSSFLFRGRTL